ncbi:MAG: LicD family protein [Sulfurovum sp.]|nr:LicD family protein [Sulfurovum sp.]
MLSRVKYFLEKNRFIATIARFVYRRTILKYKHYRQNRNFLKNAKEALLQISFVFDELKNDYWLEFGTLLGAIREKGFISHDIDIDLGLWLKDYNPNHDLVFKKYGFKRVRKIEIDNRKYGLEETYIYNGITIDLFYFRRENDILISHNFINENGKSWEKTIHDRGGLIVREKYIPYSKLMKINFLDISTYIPKDYDIHLKAIYGNTYMIPNPKWNPYTMEKNVKILEDKIGKVYNYN